jgi:hypothetical protein
VQLLLGFVRQDRVSVAHRERDDDLTRMDGVFHPNYKYFTWCDIREATNIDDFDLALS